MSTVGSNKKQPTQPKTTNPTDKTSTKTNTKKEKSAGTKKDGKKTQQIKDKEVKHTNIHGRPKPTQDTPLTQKERLFIEEYIKDGNGKQAAIRAGYKCKTPEAYCTKASELLRKINVAYQLSLLQQQMTKKNIADGEEVMQFYTRVMRGEEKDQFGLEVGARDRITAANELAKRTIDIDNRLKGIADQKVDNEVKITLDWSRK